MEHIGVFTYTTIAIYCIYPSIYSSILPACHVVLLFPPWLFDISTLEQSAAVAHCHCIVLDWELRYSSYSSTEIPLKISEIFALLVCLLYSDCRKVCFVIFVCACKFIECHCRVCRGEAIECNSVRVRVIQWFKGNVSWHFITLFFLSLLLPLPPLQL